MSNRVRFLIIYALFTATAVVITFHKDTAMPANRPFSTFPEQVQSWKMSKQNVFSDNILTVLKPTDYLSRQYKNSAGKTVSLYIGYHGGGKGGGEIHSPKHCLPGSGWHEVSSQRGVLGIPGGSINLVRAVYQMGTSKELFIYWFQVRERSISNEYALKIAEIMNSAIYNRRDAAFIRVSVPIETDLEQAVIQGEAFIQDFVPLFREYLPR